MIDLFTEDTFPLADVPRYLPKRRGGKKVHVSTVFRWCQRGYRGVILETIAIGGTKCTSREALQRFFEALSAPAPSPTPTAPAVATVRTAAARQKASEAAGKAIDRLMGRSAN